MPKTPSNKLPEDPEITSINDVETALQEIAFLDASQAVQDGILESEIHAARKQHAENCVFRVGNSRTTFAERSAKLTSLVEKFAAAHPAEFQADGKKSRRLQFGSIEFRTLPARVTYADGETAGTVAKRISGIAAFAKSITAWAAKLAFPALLRGRKIPGSAIGLQLVPKIDLAVAAKSLAAGILKAKELEALGLSIADESESITVKPAKYTPDAPAAD